MADANLQDFGRRVQKLNKKHRRLSNGYVTSVNHDGLVIARPRRRSLQFPFRGLFLTLLALLAFKAFLYTHLGPASYNQRVEKLTGGTIVEQAGAYAMKADPVTTWLAGQFTSLMD